MEGVVVKLLLFPKWNLTMPRLLAPQMCVLRRDRLHRAVLKWACHQGTDVERRRGSGRTRKGRARAGTWVKWKPLCLFFLFEAKVIMFLQFITEHSVLWLTHFSWPLDPEGEMKAKILKNWKTKQEKEAVWQLYAAGLYHPCWGLLSWNENRPTVSLSISNHWIYQPLTTDV